MKKKLKGLLLAVATVAFTAALAVPAMALADEAEGSSFADVEGDEWFAADVEWANESGLMTGTGDGTNFEPNIDNTRAMFVTSLHRLEGEPAATAADARVPEGAWYTDAALWALEAGVLEGYDDGNLGLSDPLTREQTAVFAYRYAAYKGYDLSEAGDTNVLSYLDALDISEWAMPAVQWACGEGLLRGYTDADGNLTGYLGPRDPATRAQTAAVLHRLVDDVVLPNTGADKPATPPVYAHSCSYDEWKSNNDGTHTEACACGGKGITESCTMIGYSCSLCGYEDGAFHAKVSTDEELKTALSENAKKIIVDLVANVSYDIAAWNDNAMGGEDTEEIVINGNNLTLTFNNTNSDWNNVVTGNAVLTINNATVTNSGYDATSGTWNAHDIVFKNEVVLNDVILQNAIALMGDATLNNVILTDDSSDDAYGIWIRPNGQTVAIDGLNMDMTPSGGSDRGIKIDNQYAEGADAGVTLTVKDAEFKTEKKAAILVKSTSRVDITLEDVDISGVAADPVNAVWVDEDNAQYASLVTVTGGSMIVEGSEEVADGLRKSGTTYYITKANGLAHLAEEGALSGTVSIELMSSIDMSGIEMNAILLAGNSSVTFEGNGNIISNLTLGKEGANGMTGVGNEVAGLFDMTENSGCTLSVSNLTFEDVEVSCSGYAAVIVGYAQSGNDVITLDDVDVVGATIASDSVAALVGYTVGSVTLKDCDVSGLSLTGEEGRPEKVGAYVGTANTATCAVTVTDCNNTTTYGDYGRVINGATWNGATIAKAATQEQLSAAISGAGDKVSVTLSEGEYALPSSIAGKDVTIVGSGSGTVFDFTEAYNVGDASITFENLKLLGTNANVMNGFGIQGTTGDIVYKNCTFDGAVTNEYYGNVKYIECTFTGTGYITTYAVKSAIFEGCTFDKADSRAVLVYSHGDNPVKVEISGCTFKAAEKGETGAGDWTAAIEVDTTNIPTAGTTVSISNCTYDANYNGIVRDKSAEGKANAVITVNS